MKQTPTCVNDPPKKPTTGDKIEPLNFQKVGFESGQPKVIELGCPIVRSITKKCQSQHVVLHPKGYDDHLVGNE